MRIGYFGGSFDPPHNGHIAVARAAVQAFALDKVLFVPTAAQPLKPAGPAASYADRLAMVTLLCAQDPAFEPSALEAPQPGDAPHYTVDTLQRLSATLTPDDTLYVIAGADAFLDLPRWRSPAHLLTLAEWIVLSRPGTAPAGLAPELAVQLAAMLDTLSLTPAQRARVHPMDTLHDPTTSTAIRSAIRAGSTHVNLVPASVLAYIHTHHLYPTS